MCKTPFLSGGTCLCIEESREEEEEEVMVWAFFKIKYKVTSAAEFQTENSYTEREQNASLKFIQIIVNFRQKDFV